jgi:hypothetical protein
MASVFDSNEEDVNPEFQKDVQAVFQGSTPIQDITKLDNPSMSDSLQNWWESVNQPNPRQEFDWKNVAMSGAIGAGMGAPFAGIGVVGGGIAGLTSGLVGEVSRMAGGSDVQNFGAEMLGGTVPALTKTIAKPLVKIASYRAGRVSDLVPDNSEAIAIRKAKEKIYGKNTIDTIFTTENSDATQIALRNEYFPNLQVPQDTTVSKYMREQMYDKIKALRTQQDVKVTPPKAGVVPYGTRTGDTVEVVDAPQIFSQSAEFQALMMRDLKALYERDRISKKELNSLFKIIRTDNSKNPDVVATSTKDIVNLIQNGGSFVREGVEQKKIPEEAQKLLRERFNQYLERNLGSQEYNTLKAVEKAEGVARARDAIPTILDNKFRLGSNEYDTVLSFIKDSPEGKKDFVKAISQHLSSLKDEASMKREFIRLRPALADSKVLSKEELAGISAKINMFDKTAKREKNIDLLKQVILAPMIGVLSSESASKLNAFKIYSL